MLITSNNGLCHSHSEESWLQPGWVVWSSPVLAKAQAWRTRSAASVGSPLWHGGNPLLAEESSKITPCSGTQLIAMLRESLESFQIVDLWLRPSVRHAKTGFNRDLYGKWSEIQNVDNEVGKKHFNPSSVQLLGKRV